MMFKTLLVLTAAVSAMVLPSSTPDASQLSIESVSYGGTGRQMGSVEQFLSSDLFMYALFQWSSSHGTFSESR
jgi:hypothetical protein